MFFTIKSTTPQADLAIYRAKRKARLKLITATFGPTEVLISRYLQEQYKITLRKACFDILQNAKFTMNIQKDIIVNIPDKTLNDIAKIITYGNGKFNGSRILIDSLTI